ncbi:15732_t:CDS:10 [Dentiscutata erythropus]|uniref:15732_t:CDS:1 n=1 Tax=Dentiscutata erythropus TaxID=1348616 RepID=A0A9N9DB06_9GLOM|nr:15732_t:CDS:10 [Dentiscutata erythropus]
MKSAFFTLLLFTFALAKPLEPRANDMTVKFWIKAFIPLKVDGVTKEYPKDKSKSMIEGIPIFGDCFLTDQRSFSNDINAKARMHSEVIVTFSGSGYKLQQMHKCDETTEVDCEDGDVEGKKTQNNKDMSFSLKSGSYERVELRFSAARNNPLVTGSPDIDLKGTLVIDRKKKIFSFKGKVDDFPAFEAYARVNNGPIRVISQLGPKPGAGPISLFGGANREFAGEFAFNSAGIKSQSKINKTFKITKKNNRNNKVTDKNVNDALGRVPTDLTDESLPSITDILSRSFVANIAKQSTLESQLNNESDTNLWNNISTNYFTKLKSISISSNDSSFSEKERSANHIRKKIIKEKDTPESVENSQNEQHILTNNSQYPIVLITEVPISSETDNIGDVLDTSESDYDDNLNNNGKRKALDKQERSKSTSINSTTLKFNGSTTYSKKLSDYVKKLNNLRKIKGTSNIFASNTNNLAGVYSQPIEKYFNVDSTQVSLEPLLQQMKDIDSCVIYLNLWDNHYENCQKEITNQHYKMLKLVYSLSEVFFVLLIICQQEQQKEMSQIALDKTTDNWKACWRLHHFLYVTNVSPSEMIEVKLNAKFFFEASEKEYNFLIKELLKTPEFPEFYNPKGENILELVNIAKNICII